VWHASVRGADTEARRKTRFLWVNWEDAKVVEWGEVEVSLPLFGAVRELRLCEMDGVKLEVLTGLPCTFPFAHVRRIRSLIVFLFIFFFLPRSQISPNSPYTESSSTIIAARHRSCGTCRS
jgi:hypothetical protein